MRCYGYPKLITNNYLNYQDHLSQYQTGIL